MRRQFITHPEYQFGFTLAFIRGVLVSILFPASLILLALFVASKSSSLTSHQQELLSQGFIHLLKVFGWATLAIVFVVGCFGFYMSYKFAGPVRRIEDWLIQRLSGPGTAGELTLRPGDEMSSMARLMNRLFER